VTQPAAAPVQSAPVQSAPVQSAPVQSAPVQSAPVQSPDIDESPAADNPWVTIVWNDPVNLMSYVTYVLQELFGYDEVKATKLMLDVHHKGRAVVSLGPREQMEIDVNRLHAKGLWATLQHDQ